MAHRVPVVGLTPVAVIPIAKAIAKPTSIAALTQADLIAPATT